MVKLNAILSQTERNTLCGVQGHWVKYWNRDNTAEYCSIALKFGTEFHHDTGDRDTLQMFKFKGQGHNVDL